MKFTEGLNKVTKLKGVKVPRSLKRFAAGAGQVAAGGVIAHHLTKGSQKTAAFISIPKTEKDKKRRQRYAGVGALAGLAGSAGLGAHRGYLVAKDVNEIQKRLRTHPNARRAVSHPVARAELERYLNHQLRKKHEGKAVATLALASLLPTVGALTGAAVDTHRNDKKK